MPRRQTVLFALAAALWWGLGAERAHAADPAGAVAEVETAADLQPAVDQLDGGSHAEGAGHARGGGHEDPYDLSHRNATPMLEDPTEFRSDLAIWTFVVFICLAALLLKFAWRPVVQGLEKREQSIAAMINEAKQSQDRAAEQLKQYEARLAAASAEAQQLIARAQKDAEGVKDRIVAEAQAAARKERERAVADIENAKNNALHEITEKSVDLAVSMAGRIVRRQLRPEDQATLIREALDQLPSRN